MAVRAVISSETPVLSLYFATGRTERARTAERSSTHQTKSAMEFINKIELRGIVGTSTLTRVGESQVCRFSLATDYSYKDRDGNPVVDTTRFNVTAWEGRNIPDLRSVVRGAIVQVSGRVRTYKYTTADGVEKSSWEVFARRVSVLAPDDDPLQPQRYL